MQNSQPHISVVIPAFNEEQTIEKCLTALTQQDTKEPFEVILVDNNSTDNTVAIAEKFKSTLDLRIIHEPKKGRSPARKAGFDQSRGELIFSTDADAQVPKNWISSILPHFSDKSVKAVTGTCYIDDCSKRINWSFNIFQPIAMIAYRLFIGHFWLSGFNFAIRKEIYHQSGGFNPNLNSQEDTELSFRVNKLGKIKYVRNPAVQFSGRRFKNGMIRGLFPYFTSYLTFFLLRKEKGTIISDVR